MEGVELMKIGGTNVIDFARVSSIPKFVINVKAGDSKRKISLALLENNIPFCSEYIFPDLIDKAYLRFDFGIYNNDKLV